MARLQPDLSTIGRILLVGGCAMAVAALGVLARGTDGLALDDLAKVAPPGFPIELFRHLHEIALVQLALASPLIVAGWGVLGQRNWAVVLARCAVAAIALAIVAFVVFWVASVGLRLPGVSPEEQLFHLFFLGALSMAALTVVGVCAALLWALGSRAPVTKTRVVLSDVQEGTQRMVRSRTEQTAVRVLRWVLGRLRGKVLLLYLVVTVLGSGSGGRVPGVSEPVQILFALGFVLGVALVLGVPLLILLGFPAPYVSVWHRRLAWGSVGAMLVLLPLSQLDGTLVLSPLLRGILGLTGILFVLPLFLATGVIGRVRRASGEYKVGDGLGTFVGLCYYSVLGVFFVRKQLLRALEAATSRT